MRRLCPGARTVLFLAFLLPTLLLSAQAAAHGLYKGHGRRSSTSARPEHPWAARVNLSGGFHGAVDNLHDSQLYLSGGYFDGYGAPGLHDSDRFLRFGGYAAAGIEVHLGSGVTLEPYAMYRDLNDDDHYLIADIDGTFNVSTFADIEAISGGVTLRKYVQGRSGWAFWGLGVGAVQSEAIVTEVVDGVETFAFDGTDEAVEAHFVVGFDARMGRSWSLGLELGYRHTWLDEVADFNGLVLGARLGLLVP